MGQRLDLHNVLLAITPNVYFQPPPNLHIEYPCIVYQRDFADTRFADDLPYSHTIRYAVTVIDPNPDSELPGKVASLPMSTFNRFYAADSLNHDVYSVYF